jgi:hypothetical protein
MSRRILFSVAVTNLALAGWAICWSALVGWQSYVLIQGTTLVAGGAVAAWMLYIQHQYEETYYKAAEEWNFEDAALQGSSYLKLPKALAWAVGNANYHHVHHLSAKIPNYHLRAAHERQPMFAHTPVVTVRSGIDALRLKLWDEERGCLVPYPPRRARSAAQYHFPRAKPPKAMSPTSTTISPTQKLQKMIRTIPTMTMMPPREIPAIPPRSSDPATRSSSVSALLASMLLPSRDRHNPQSQTGRGRGARSRAAAVKRYLADHRGFARATPRLREPPTDPSRPRTESRAGL